MIPTELLVSAYASGWFPMAVGESDIRWFSPDPRGIIPLDGFRIPSRLARVVRGGRFRIEVNRAFGAVMRACASSARGAEEGGTWIDDEILESYEALHRLGLAHSVETWQGDALVGGLYGVSLRGAFFGESMFHTATDASKVALVALVERLRALEYRLLDIQWVTEHLSQFGAVEIPKREYLVRLDSALGLERRFTDPVPQA
ncbi:leucyl/phenylalanyl-tRNA--protein transferase [soil metagenome]|nr:leucyl/phenylalanyl-tRNA--protein transferase [Acidobacteriota bacterium]